MTEPDPAAPECRPHREPRYKILVFTSLGCVINGLAYSPLTRLPDRTVGLDIASGLLPLWLLGLAWLLVGILGMVSVFLRRPGHLVFAAQFGMFVLWSMSYWLAIIVYGSPRAFIVAGWFTAFAGIVAYATRVEPPLWSPPSWWANVWARLPWRR